MLLRWRGVSMDSAEKNPIKEYLTEKRAAGFLGGLAEGARHAVSGMPEHLSPPASVGQGVGRMLGRGGATAGLLAGGAAAVGGLAAGAAKLYDAATKASDFRNMMKY